MKRSIKSRYQLMLLIFFAIFILESALILVTLVRPDSIVQLRNNIHSIVILFILILFVYFIVLFYYIPYQFEKGLKEIYDILEDISEGKYDIDLELRTYHQKEEISSLINALQKMMHIIIRFDGLKGDKIFEQHQRLQFLLDLLPEGCLIISNIGEIIYNNDFIRNHFPELAENLNIIEVLLPPYIEDELKPMLLDSLKNGDSLHENRFKAGQDGNSYTLNSRIVRNRKGQTVSAVFVITQAGDNV